MFVLSLKGAKTNRFDDMRSIILPWIIRGDSSSELTVYFKLHQTKQNCNCKLISTFCLPGVNEFCFSLNHKLIRHFSETNCARLHWAGLLQVTRWIRLNCVSCSYKVSCHSQIDLWPPRVIRPGKNLRPTHILYQLFNILNIEILFTAFLQPISHICVEK